MKDIIIVGGGLIGMLTARTLQDAGLSTLLIDQNELGKESSWAGGGILSPLYPWRYPKAVSLLARYGHDHYSALCDALRDETQVDPQWQRSGLLIPDTHEYETARQWTEAYGYELQLLDNAKAVQDCEPQLATGFESGLFMPEIAQMRNPRLVRALSASLRQRPLLIAEHNPVTALIIEQGKVQGVKLGDQAFYAEKVIVTAGAWTSLFPQLTQLTVKPVMGQMILFRGEPNVLNRIILHDGHYLIPRKDGRILCGSTLEMNGFTKQVTEDAFHDLRQTALSLMPALDGVPIRNHWAGLRPGSPDGVPYIGEHPEISGLYVNAGHYRYGVTMGLGSVQLLVDQLFGRESFVDPALYRLDLKREPTAEFCE